MPARPLKIIDLGRIAYRLAYELQLRHLGEVLEARDSGIPEIGRLLLVEHDPPVITISKRQGADRHLLASREHLAKIGIEVQETDRGGDITYHGPGQLVAYPILDLNALGLNLHGYMRFLEQVAIDTCAQFGVQAHRDSCATGVWVGNEHEAQASAKRTCNGPRPTSDSVSAVTRQPSASAKICAMGVRVRRWITMHGLALNVTTNLDHFNLIVPCGLTGRPVTSLQRELGDGSPSFDDAKRALAENFVKATALLADAGARSSQPA